MPHNYITSEDVPTPSSPTQKTWEELGVPAALIAKDTQANLPGAEASSSTTGRKPRAPRKPRKPAAPSTGRITIDHNYSLEELSQMSDRQLKSYLGQNKSRQKEGWETRVEMAELVLGQRGDVL